MTENEKMSLVIQLAEKALEKNELPIACIICIPLPHLLMVRLSGLREPGMRIIQNRPFASRQ